MYLRKMANMTAEIACLTVCAMMAAPYFMILLSPFVGR